MFAGSDEWDRSKLLSNGSYVAGASPCPTPDGEIATRASVPIGAEAARNDRLGRPDLHERDRVYVYGEAEGRQIAEGGEGGAEG
jgi:hypothetical protein